jgi:hypothetical protein
MNTILYVPFKGNSYYWHIMATGIEEARVVLAEKYGLQGREELFDGIAEVYCHVEQTFPVKDDKEPVHVRYRMHEGRVIAVMGNMSYDGVAWLTSEVRGDRPATPAEYAELHERLQGVIEDYEYLVVEEE